MTDTFERTVAKRLAVNDHFVPDQMIEDARQHGWSWRVVEHDLTQRGDYSTVVDSDGTTWTERFQPDETVWLRTGSDRAI